MRLQAREKTGKLTSIREKVDSRIGKLVSDNPICFNGTKVTKDFIEERPHSWQAHLSRISSFIINEKIWWKEEDNSYAFLMGTAIPTIDRKVKHFRSCVIQDVEKQSADNWKYILDYNIPLPIQSVQMYDENGELISRHKNDDNETSGANNDQIETNND